jgi:hypothetical protein
MKNHGEFCPVNDFQYFCQRKTGLMQWVFGRLCKNSYELKTLSIVLVPGS